MNITPTEAEEALNAIQSMMNKTKKAISNSGAYNFLIVWGAVWLFGFLANHFFTTNTAGLIWMGLDILGGAISVILGIRLSRNVRSPSGLASGKRIAWFWLLLFIYCFSMILVISPVDGKQMAMVIILFVMIGWIAMGLLLSVTSVWWGLGITALALFGYFLLPDFFHLWMAFLGGGGMIFLGFYIRKKW
ncbi:MAG: hypothetical protein WBB69_08455 [Anaerolineales bacterium]